MTMTRDEAISQLRKPSAKKARAATVSIICSLVAEFPQITRLGHDLIGLLDDDTPTAPESCRKQVSLERAK